MYEGRQPLQVLFCAGKFAIRIPSLTSEVCKSGTVRSSLLVCLGEALLHHHFQFVALIYDAFVRDCLRANVISKGEA